MGSNIPRTINSDHRIAATLLLLLLLLLLVLVLSLALQPGSGYGLLVSQGFLITHNDAPQSVGLLWTGDQLVAETSTWQHTQQTNIHAPAGIGTHDRSRRAAVDVFLRPRGHWDRRLLQYTIYPIHIIANKRWSSPVTGLNRPRGWIQV
jgi:hypothetical protein